MVYYFLGRSYEYRGLYNYRAFDLEDKLEGNRPCTKIIGATYES